jgi:hypothetical protein
LTSSRKTLMSPSIDIRSVVERSEQSD